MTLTLEIPNDLSAQIERVATARGALPSPETLAAYLLEAARHELEREPDTAQKRRAAAAAGLGMFAGHGATVDEFLVERDAEALAEVEREAQTR